LLSTHSFRLRRFCRARFALLWSLYFGCYWTGGSQTNSGWKRPASSEVIPYRSTGSEPNRSSSGNKDHLHLVKYKVDPKVGQQLRLTYTTGNLNFIFNSRMLYFKINTFYFPIFIDLDYLEIEACGGTKALCTELPVETAVAFLKKIRRSGITRGSTNTPNCATSSEST